MALLIGLGTAFTLLAASPARAQSFGPKPSENPNPVTPVAENSPSSVDGVRMPDFENRMRSVFPQATSARETSILPAEFGGTSLMGLVSRLLGEHVDREHEGLNIRRYIYKALEGDRVMGLGHASSFDAKETTAQVFVFYEPGGSIRNVKVEGIPSSALADLERGGYLEQFSGRSSEDFEVTLGRRGRIKSRAPFLGQAKKPASQPLRSYFDKIMHSVRFNTAFMEIAYFIAQHPTETPRPETAFLSTGGQTIFQNPFQGGSPVASPAPNASPLQPNSATR